MKNKSLEDLISAAGSPVKLLRNSQMGPVVFPGVPPEFSNWRDEQLAWRETCVLFDQTHHMTDLFIQGPDVIALLSHVGVNSFKTFGVNKAKQFISCNGDGYIIGDSILLGLEPNKVNVIGRPSSIDWLQYVAESGKYDVKVERDERSAMNPRGRKLYRYQVQGPAAIKMMEKLNGQPLPEIKFFNMGEMRISGKSVRLLRHGMSGVPGFELFGPREDGDDIRAAILEAGSEFGLRQAGSRAYMTANLESGWMPSPLPAIFSGEKMRPYREWLPSDWFDSRATLGGSYYSDNIEDYYLTPYELGYGIAVNFDHDFIGKEALQRMGSEPRRKKVTLAWNPEDVTRAIGTMFQKGSSAKYIEWPRADYSTFPYDAVHRNGKLVGVSTCAGYSFNEKSMLSLAIVDADMSEAGTEVEVIWGEEDGGTSKPMVERHVQTEIRAIVSPVPYSEVSRTVYAGGWRSKVSTRV